MALATMKDISNRFGGRRICRRCINMLYNAKLVRSDCKYEDKEECPYCGEVRHLVSGFTLSGKGKMRGLSYSGEDTMEFEEVNTPIRIREEVSTPIRRREEVNTPIRVKEEEKKPIRIEEADWEETRELRARLRKREKQVDALYRELDDMTAKYRELAMVMRDSANAIIEATEDVVRPGKKLSVL